MVLQVGDIECHRHKTDQDSMAAPTAKKTLANLGDFADCCMKGEEWPWVTYFIGGNHECYGWLDSKDGTENTSTSKSRIPVPRRTVAPNLHYLGRAGFFPIKLSSAEGTEERILNIGFYLHTCAVPILRNAKKPEHNSRNLFISYTIVFLSYMIIGGLGYYGFMGKMFSKFFITEIGTERSG